MKNCGQPHFTLTALAALCAANCAAARSVAVRLPPALRMMNVPAASAQLAQCRLLLARSPRFAALPPDTSMGFLSQQSSGPPVLDARGHRPDPGFCGNVENGDSQDD